VVVAASAPKRQPDPHAAGQTLPEHHRTPQINTLEATGLLVIAALVLVLTLFRYWHYISWSSR
jgi:hypothetical protein